MRDNKIQEETPDEVEGAMESTPKAQFSRWRVVVICVVTAAMFVAACSVLLDHNETQCKTDQDCTSFGGHPYCQASVCVASSLGPEGCFVGTPTTPEQFANQCSTAKCESFDNCGRLGLCTAGAPLPQTIPPVVDAGVVIDAPIDAPGSGPPPCLNGIRNVVVVTGSTALQPFLTVVAKVLAQNSPPYAIAYQGSGSCNGVENIFNPIAARRLVKDTFGRTNLLFEGEKAPTACSFGTGVPVDVAISDVFSKSCNPAYVPSDAIADYLGPVQPMTFVVPSASTENAISAEMGRVVFGRGSQDMAAKPYVDPALYFVRNFSSGTQQMIARAIQVEAKQWWGIDRGGSSRVRDLLLAVAPAKATGAVGILSTDFADAERNRLRILAFKDRSQICGYYPDTSVFTRDKRNVRDGHYSIWGPVHLYTPVTGGVPSPAAAALVTRFALPRLDTPLLDVIIKAGLVPQCAMKVKRTDEMGPMATFAPEYQCGCYFEATVPNGAAPDSCIACNGPADCPTATPACNNGYCEVK
jgi:ABC-type phosphate transport system substrate-binding protein